ncbi:helix-turn-helix transcriptional regulator [Microbacterium profundi]
MTAPLIGRDAVPFLRDRDDTGRGYVIGRPAGPPLSAVESVRAERIHRAVFGHAKIVHVLEGAARIETATGIHELTPGYAMALGAGMWCSVRPDPTVRLWTLYFDESFLRSHMRWVLADTTRVRPGVHPDAWDGSALVLQPGVDILHRIEPLWRQISLVNETAPPEVATTRLISLFSRAVEIALPTLLADDGAVPERFVLPVRGRLAQPPIARPVRRSVVLLRSRMTEPWTVGRLAAEVAVSRAHLTRVFTQQVGVAPMRFLIETRLTEFTRLIEETDLPIADASRQVGWNDARVAAVWFRKRFGITPTQYRRHPHASCTGAMPCESCRGVCALTPVLEPVTRAVSRDSRRDAHIRRLS